MAPTNPASIFIRLAGFNVAVALVFVVFYFIYDAKGGARSYYLLLAAGAALLAAVGSIVAYFHFNRKILDLNLDADENESEDLVHPADRARQQRSHD